MQHSPQKRPPPFWCPKETTSEAPAGQYEDQAQFQTGRWGSPSSGQSPPSCHCLACCSRLFIMISLVFLISRKPLAQVYQQLEATEPGPPRVLPPGCPQGCPTPRQDIGTCPGAFCPSSPSPGTLRPRTWGELSWGSRRHPGSRPLLQVTPQGSSAGHHPSAMSQPWTRITARLQVEMHGWGEKDLVMAMESAVTSGSWGGATGL